MKPIPLLFLSDSPSLPTGLARITKDLAVLTSQLPQFRVGVMGRGGVGSSKLPFAQFNFDESRQWGEMEIEGIWEDFAGGDQGVVMTIWDASRLNWFAQPRMGGQLQTFLQSGRFQRWGYFPVDSYGVGGKLTGLCADTLAGYDRVLAYTLFGKQVLAATMGVEEVEWAPHGYNADVFKPRDRAAGRAVLGVDEACPLIGCVMTNQARKDWATAFGAIARLKNQKPDVKFWAHVDVVERHWDLRALAVDFGLVDTVIPTFNGQYTSEQLSYVYSACDVTMLPSLGEGFGYPIVESLACGVPVLHGDYGGGVELIPDTSWLIPSIAERLEGLWNNVRPVWNPADWANTLSSVIERLKDEDLRDVCTGAVEHLRWGKLWPGVWKKWMLRGIGQ
jgi:glycosyltransferase involved in cell wall biosynthesis